MLNPRSGVRREVIFASTEAAVADIHRTVANVDALFLREIGASGPQVVRGAWLEMVTMVEVYVDDTLEQLFDIWISDCPSGMRDHLGRGFRAASSNWIKRSEWFQLCGHTRLEDISSWKLMDSVLFVRNSLAHGKGGPARKQKFADWKSKTALLGLTTDNREIFLDYKDLRASSSACIDFVMALDLQLRACGFTLE